MTNPKLNFSGTSNLLVVGCAKDGYDGLIGQFGASDTDPLKQSNFNARHWMHITGSISACLFSWRMEGPISFKSNGSFNKKDNDK